MQSLPILQDTTSPNSQIPLRTQNRLVYWLRLAMIAGVLFGLSQLARVLEQRSNSSNKSEVPTQAFAADHFQQKDLVFEPSTGDPSLICVRQADGTLLGYIAETSPKSDKIIGYSGPQNVLLLLDEEQRITGAQLLNSRDTVDHVAKVVNTEAFWKQFVGWQVGGESNRQVDAVSGATLTSLAVAEAIAFRLSGKRASLRFPAALDLDEVQVFFPEAHRTEEDIRVPGLNDVRSENGELLGQVLRTGPLIDSETGYQGPTEVMLAIDREGVVFKARLRTSFDNQPYVRYTKQEARFWKPFVGKSLTELAEFDIDAAGVEGVSGATMTSMAAARTVVAAAKKVGEQLLAEEQSNKPQSRPIRFSTGEIATLVLAAICIPWAFAPFRGRRSLRFVWQLATIVVIVLISGNVLSIALFSAWVRTGWSFALAPGLCVLAAVAILSPILFRRNVYCDHVCPHGIAQQWLLPLARKSRANPHSSKNGRSKSSLASGLAWIARLLRLAVLLAAVTWLLFGVPKQLTWFEPFDAYAWRVGLSVSGIVWVISLLFAAREPMGYCRHACPTGLTLDYLKRSKAAAKWNRGDLAIGIAAIVVWLSVGLIHFRS